MSHHDSGTEHIDYAGSVYPYLQTRICIVSDGFIPFDSATYHGSSNFNIDNVGSNGVIHVTDIMRYKIQTTVNDTSNSGDLISIVCLDLCNTIAPLARQQWKAIPDTYIASGSGISTDKQILTCNLGVYRVN